MSSWFSKKLPKWPAKTDGWMPMEAAVMQGIVGRCTDARLRQVLEQQILDAEQVTRHPTVSGYECSFVTARDAIWMNITGHWIVANADFRWSDRDACMELLSLDGLIGGARFYVGHDPSILERDDVVVQKVLFARHYEDPPPTLRGWVADLHSRGVLSGFSPPTDKSARRQFFRDHPNLPAEYREFLEQCDGCGIDACPPAQIFGIHDSQSVQSAEGEELLLLVRTDSYEHLALAESRPGTPLVWVVEDGSDTRPCDQTLPAVVKQMHAEATA